MMQPGSMNGWDYAEGNPVRYVDPSGYLKKTEEVDADKILQSLETDYGVLIGKDYGWQTGYCGQYWLEGAWGSLTELQWVQQAYDDMATTMGSGSKFKSAMRGTVRLVRSNITKDPFPFIGPIRPFAPPLGAILGDIIMPDYLFSNGKDYATFNVVHESAHVWDRRTGLQLSEGMSEDANIHTRSCANFDDSGNCVGWLFDTTSGSEPPPGYIKFTSGHPEDWTQQYAGTRAMEDWAESFASVVYPDYYASGTQLGPNRRKYVEDQIRAIP